MAYACIAHQASALTANFPHSSELARSSNLNVPFLLIHIALRYSGMDALVLSSHAFLQVSLPDFFFEIVHLYFELSYLLIEIGYESFSLSFSLSSIFFLFREKLWKFIKHLFLPLRDL